MSDFSDKLTSFLDHFIALSEAEDNSEADKTFNKEFMSLKVESQQYKEQNTFPSESGQLPVNKKKNRFKDILPFEYTRVQLHKIEDVEGSDYINANYILGPDGNVNYIASQGPLPHTVNDFWRMLWYHQIEIVVMACREVEMAKPKCQCYWPPCGESVLFGAIQDHEENVSNDFIIRQLTAECQGEKQVIRQFHYNAWPDHGRPTSATPIIRMIEMFREHRDRHDIPFVVHCSAGCGRTGTIIAIDFARQMLLAEDIPGDFSVYSIVQKMRQQRPAMVQALDQYVFVYMAIVELVQRTLNNVPQPPIKTLKFEKEVIPPSPTPEVNESAIYANVETKNNYDETAEETQFPSVPIGRTDSVGEKPVPPRKPVKPKPDVNRKPSDDSATPVKPPRKPKVDEIPVPAPRKNISPTPPSTTSTESLYSVPKKHTSSTPNKPAAANNVSLNSTPSSSGNRSILDTLISEVGDVLEPEDFKEVTGHSKVIETTYSSLDNDIPPPVPEQRKDVLEVGPIYEETNKDMPITVGARSSTPTPSGSRPVSYSDNNNSNSSSLALSIATMRPGQMDMAINSKKFNDDLNTSQKFASRSFTASPRKAPPMGIKDSANNKYSFPGNYGFGVRVGKPRGPRPIPSHWNVLNGAIMQ